MNRLTTFQKRLEADDFAGAMMAWPGGHRSVLRDDGTYRVTLYRKDGAEFSATGDTAMAALHAAAFAATLTPEQVAAIRALPSKFPAPTQGEPK